MACIIREIYSKGTPGHSVTLESGGRVIAHGPGPDFSRYAPPTPRRPADKVEGRREVWILTSDDRGDIISRVEAALRRPGRDTSLDRERRAVIAALTGTGL